MNYIEFYDEMVKAGLLSSNWKNVLSLLSNMNSPTDNELKVYILYFSYIEDGNVYLPLDKAVIQKHFEDKIAGLIIQSVDEEKAYDFEPVKTEIAIVTDNLSITNSSVISTDGKDLLFVVKDNKLYTRKHFNAITRILSSADRLFKNNPIGIIPVDYSKALKGDMNLTEGQNEIIKKGLTSNLFITGGPGTGKTTSILFLLLALLKDNDSYNVYLTAPSGKAASRMKESIIKGIKDLETSFYEDNKVLIENIKALEEYTIHRLLSINGEDNSFRFNIDNQFKKDSIFIVDEASMIDVNIFASLLDAIPDEARVFIMGDKNQLPSVESGAVFAELIQKYPDNVVTLTKSMRFGEDTEIYKLSEAINSNGDISYIKDNWQPYDEFKVDTVPVTDKSTPVYYYLDNAKAGTRHSDKKMIDSISKKWYEAFYTNFFEMCNDITEDGFSDIWNISENARILCANNSGIRSVSHINKYIRKEFYSDKTSVSGYYPGELLMVTENEHSLELYNGDCGVTVKFKDDETLYLMFKKGIKLNIDDKKVENKIFKLGDFVFYPVRLIGADKITSAFAITIHKSQGSDYNNILVVLPKTKGHPLLNRQIVYTAITRTKGKTYILSNQENMENARDTVLVRNTF